MMKWSLDLSISEPLLVEEVNGLTDSPSPRCAHVLLVHQAPHTHHDMEPSIDQEQPVKSII